MKTSVLLALCPKVLGFSEKGQFPENTVLGTFSLSLRFHKLLAWQLVQFPAVEGFLLLVLVAVLFGTVD